LLRPFFVDPEMHVFSGLWGQIRTVGSQRQAGRWRPCWLVVGPGYAIVFQRLEQQTSAPLSSYTPDEEEKGRLICKHQLEMLKDLKRSNSNKGKLTFVWTVQCAPEMPSVQGSSKEIAPIPESSPPPPAPLSTGDKLVDMMITPTATASPKGELGQVRYFVQLKESEADELIEIVRRLRVTRSRFNDASGQSTPDDPLEL